MHEATIRQTRIRGVVALVVLAVASLALASGAGAGRPSDVLGQLYVNDNTAGVNTVAGFDRHADGSLTPISGSPFAVGGAGTGHGVASQGSLQQSADGRYLLAVDAGSNEISVLRIKPHGDLQVADVSCPQTAANPVSIAVHGRPRLRRERRRRRTPNYTGFTLNAGGHLSALTDSTVTLPDGSQPGDVLFNGDGTQARRHAREHLADRQLRGRRERLAHRRPWLAVRGAGPRPVRERVPARPNPTQLFVSNAHGGPGNGSVSAFAAAADGTLTSIGASPFANNQTAPCWVEISHDGHFLFAVNTAVSTISSYSIAANGSLTLLGNTTMDAAAHGPEDARLSPDGSTLWVVDTASNAISGFAVSGGTLTELGSSPTFGPTGAAPTGVVVT